MMPMLIFSDLHLRPESEDVCFEVLDAVLEEAKARAAGTIAFLGDWWHLRYQVPVHLLNRVGEWIKKAVKNFELILLPGNHDQVDEMGEHALQVFSEYGAKVYTTPIVNGWGAWMPYRKDPKVVHAQLHQLAASCVKLQKPLILFGHLPVFGALMNNQMADADGLSPESFSGFQKVILGHYHKRQTFLDGLVTYAGSPWQTRADEYGQEKGFALWDGYSLKYINRVFGRRFFRFEATNAMNLKTQFAEMVDLPGPNDIITINMPTKGDLDAGMKFLQKHQYQHVVGNAADISIPQPRYGFKKGTSLATYAQVWAKEKGPTIATEAELMTLWGEIES